MLQFLGSGRMQFWYHVTTRMEASPKKERNSFTHTLFVGLRSMSDINDRESRARQSCKKLQRCQLYGMWMLCRAYSN